MLLVKCHNNYFGNLHRHSIHSGRIEEIATVKFPNFVVVLRYRLCLNIRARPLFSQKYKGADFLPKIKVFKLDFFNFVHKKNFFFQTDLTTPFLADHVR